MEFLYLEQLFTEARTLGQNGVAGEIQDSHNQPCLLETREAFHIENIIGIIYGITHILQCVVACRYIPACISMTHLDKARQCILSSTFLPSDNYGMTGPGVREVFGRVSFIEMSCPSKTNSVASYITDHGQYTGQCGFMPLHNLEKRIVGGKRVNPPYSFPWVGQVFFLNQHHCTTFLIAEGDESLYTEWAVSAAHCFFKPEGFKAGVMSVPETDLHEYKFVFANPDRRFNMPHVVTRWPSAIICNTRYPSTQMSGYDVALIKFTHRIDFNAYVAPVCLPRSNDQRPSRPNKCLLSSYGYVQDLITGRKVLHASLQYREIPIAQDVVPGLLEFPGEPPNKYCIGWLSHESTARGDSGAPHFCPENGRYVVFGVLQGLVPDYGNVVSVPKYSLVGKMPCFLDWIHSVFAHDGSA